MNRGEIAEAVSEFMRQAKLEHSDRTMLWLYNGLMARIQEHVAYEIELHDAHKEEERRAKPCPSAVVVKGQHVGCDDKIVDHNDVSHFNREHELIWSL